MKRKLAAAVGMSLLTGLAFASPLSSGLNAANMDRTVKPGDDFYQHVNGQWLARTPIPADKQSYGAFDMLYDKTLEDLRSIVESVQKTPRTESERKVGDLFAAFMDEARVETLGLAPLQAELARIDGLKDAAGIARQIAHSAMTGANAPFGIEVHQDNKDSTRYIVDLSQAGLGLPDRDYYLSADAKFAQFREAYRAHVERMLALAGDRDAKARAAELLALETLLAGIQWTRVENRDPVKRYNKVKLADLDVLAPGFEWKAFLDEARIAGKVEDVIISQPSYFSGLAAAMKVVPLATWKTYFRWHALRAAAPYLGKAWVDESFAFYGTVLRGVPQNLPRWKRGVRLVNASIGEALGEAYVARHFPAQSKARVEALVQNLLAAYRQSIETLDWMGPETKKQAQAKLSTYMLKLGYPDTWRDYGKLGIVRGDLLGNVARANEFEYMRNVNKLGKPIDRAEWGMTPQTINAYYNPELNEIVFPAAILQPPFFDPNAEDAVNYGAIGAVIGHEISHGFDDEGSKYDGAGNLRDWWTPSDHEAYRKKTEALVAQYSAFEPVKGHRLNGELTLGENIADNSGLAIAFKAYKISLAGKPSPVIDGMTGEQRFYAGFAQVWQEKMRENAMIAQIKADPHSIPVFRVLGTLANQPGFFEAFDVKPGDRMYLPPEKRVIIW